jgi:hypothetical protein
MTIVVQSFRQLFLLYRMYSLHLGWLMDSFPHFAIERIVSFHADYDANIRFKVSIRNTVVRNAQRLNHQRGKLGWSQYIDGFATRP